MNKRQRKKWRLGEFREFGFALRFRAPEPTSTLEADSFFNAFIEEVERLGLAVAGGTGGIYDVMVMGFHETIRTVSSQQRDSLIQWLTQRPEVTDVQAGPLTDLWYGSFEDAAPSA